jgi:hypothetical protein
MFSSLKIPASRNDICEFFVVFGVQNLVGGRVFDEF